MHGVEAESEKAREPALAIGEGMPKKVMGGMEETPAPPLVRSTQLIRTRRMISPKASVTMGEIVTAQAQDRKAEDHAPQGGEQARDRQADPEAPGLPEIDPECAVEKLAQWDRGGEQREGVGTDRIEGHIAEVEKPGEADDDVQGPSQASQSEDVDAEIDPVAARSKPSGTEHREYRIGDEDAEEERLEDGAARSPRSPRVRVPARPAPARPGRQTVSSRTSRSPPTIAAKMATMPKR